MLPEYKWSYFEVSSNSDKPEGLAILSRHPIIESKVFKLQTINSPDTNQRILIKAVIDIDHRILLPFYVTHMSYSSIVSF